MAGQSGIPTAGSGSLTLPADDSTKQKILSEPWAFPYGRFEITVSCQATPSAGAISFRWNKDVSGGPTNNDYHGMSLRQTGGFVVSKSEGGWSNLIDGSWPADTTTHTLAAERNGSNEWTAYVDGNQTGSAVTDDSMPESPSRIELVNEMDVVVNIEEIRIY